jgi:hypothetical protein
LMNLTRFVGFLLEILGKHQESWIFASWYFLADNLEQISWRLDWYFEENWQFLLFFCRMKLIFLAIWVKFCCLHIFELLKMLSYQLNKKILYFWNQMQKFNHLISTNFNKQSHSFHKYSQIPTKSQNLITYYPHI